MKVALVHDWLVGMRGGERVLEESCNIFPDASIFTLFHEPGSVSRTIESRPIYTSVLDRIPYLRRHYRYLLPLLPWAAATLDLRGFDVVLSVSHAVAKAIQKPEGSLHFCYCLTPMRYIWDMQDDYFQCVDPFRFKRSTLQAMSYRLRRWDCATAGNVDYFIAQCRHVRERISKFYHRDSALIYPPVDTDFFSLSGGKDDGFYLIVSALVPYKRVDIAVEAFNRLGCPLVIVGKGPDLDWLKHRAAGNIQFKGFVSNDELLTLYRRCRAVIITGREDFGLVSLEAQACGRPAVAFGAGGSLESILHGETGILFRPQTAAALVEAIRECEATTFNPDTLRKNAERFSKHVFRRSLLEFIQNRSKAEGPDARTTYVYIAPRGAVPLTDSNAQPHPSETRFRSAAKRGMDITLSIAGLLVLGLPILILALLIWYGSEGPAFFRQRRVGLRGRTFMMIKLRTMRKDAELLSGPVWPVINDPRCIAGGAFLRKYGLDELPQLWNVLKGDMSLVGPRPERPEFHTVFEQRFPKFKSRLEVPGGITGLAQIRGWRGDTSLEERLKSDLEYIENWSFWKDVLILWRTPFVLLRQKVQRNMRPAISDTVGLPRLDERSSG